MKIKINNLTFKYPSAEGPVLENISLSVEAGDFVVLAGESGCGKTTLLKFLKPELAPAGEKTGEVIFSESDELESGFVPSPLQAGYVFQNPDDGIVCDKVWHELVFSLENSGMSQDEMKKRLDFAADYFGIRELLFKDTAELSGGQRQIVNLAAVATGQPELLILDEPVSQLDPEMTEAFLGFLKRLNRERGITVIMSEHRPEAVCDAASTIVIMENGRISEEKTPEEFFREEEEKTESCESAAEVQESDDREVSEPLIEMKNVSYAYRKGQSVLEDFSLKVFPGQTLVLSGDNGSGKTTALLLLAGGLKPSSGEIIRRAGSGMVPQNPMDVFSSDPLNSTVSEKTARLTGLSEVYYAHPYDLSGGQQQRLALAMVLEADPEVVILDEPSKGLDSEAKKKLIRIIDGLKSEGKAVVLVSHDRAFCRRVADRMVELQKPARRLSQIAEIPEPEKEAASSDWGSGRSPVAERGGISDRNTNRRKLLQGPAVWALTFALVAATILGNLYLLDGRGSVAAAFAVIIEMLIPFGVSFERKAHSARKLAVLAVISAIAVASRAAFFMLPEFKPMAAFVIIAAVAYGAEEGFFVGAMAALVSDFFFGQGPWTPWQMLALGLIGFAAGIVYRKKDSLSGLKGEKILLCLLGGGLVLCVYGGIMNLASVLMWNQYPSADIIIASYITGFPMDCIHVLATVLFLWILARPMVEKLRRVNLKYEIS